MNAFRTTALRHDPATDRLRDADLETVQSDATLRAWRRPGTSRRLVICLADFDGGMPDPALIRAVGDDATANILVLSDPSRRWFGDKAFSRQALSLVDADARRLRTDDIVVLGIGAAAHQALELATLRRVDLVLALSARLPETAPEPSVMRRLVSRLVFGRKAGTWSDKTTYLMVFGDHEDDRDAVSRVPILQRMNLIILPDTQRESLDILSDAGLLDTLLQHAYARGFMALRKHLRGPYRRLVFTIGGY